MRPSTARPAPTSASTENSDFGRKLRNGVPQVHLPDLSYAISWVLGFGLRGFWGSVASGAVTADDFWALIDATRPAEPDPDLHAAALTRDLATRGVDATVAFARQFDAAMDALYRWDLWGGGYLLLGGLSDDGFEYLRAWVVGEGRATWERVLDDPEGYLVALVGEATADGGET